VVETAFEYDEIITTVAFPLARKAAYMKFPNPDSRAAPGSARSGSKR